MPVVPGARLGPYEVLGTLGAGGMGEVYKARDTRLERIVALKVAKERFGERFRNEALAVAALNHPHVCTLHDVGPDYLVMELVEGKPLAGPLPLHEVRRLASQIASALEHAHRQGIVHRDLKPANILVTKAGVKVLDFGLAKRIPEAPAGESGPTLTEAGVVVGTPRFMAPEQIEGKPADARTDVFAFGLVLYEMLTGRHAFEGENAAGVMAAILEREPMEIATRRPETPPALAEVVKTCLAKDPEDRWQSVRELRHALDWASRTGVAASAPSRGRWIGAALVSLVALAAAVALVWTTRRPKVQKPAAVRFQVALPPGARLAWHERGPALSPAGDQIVIAAVVDGTSRLLVRPLSAAAFSPVPGTEGASGPFWSPDGGQIGFVAQGQMKRIDLSSGSVRVVCDIKALFGASWDRTLIMLQGFRGATWNREGTIVFASAGDLFRVPASGGEPARLGERSPRESSRSWPHFLPDGRRYLFLSQAPRPDDQGIFVASLDSASRQQIVASDHDAAYAPSGHLLFVRGDSVFAQPFDAARLLLSGEPLPLAQPVELAWPPYRGAAYSVSANGVLAWRETLPPDKTQLTWFDRSGKRLGVLGEASEYSNPALSPDGEHVAVSRRDPRAKTRDVWIFDLARATSRRLTFDPADDFGPVWSPDGKWIAFSSDRRGTRDLYRKLASGSGGDEPLLESKDSGKNAEAWSPDGSFLVYNYWPGGRPADLYLLPVSAAGAGKPVPFLTSEFREDHSSLAPSGRWIAYRSDESGRDEVYVKAISPKGVPGPGRWQVSTQGGLEPRWRGDGRELYYMSGSTVMAVGLKADGDTFEAGTPRPLFEARVPPTPRRNRFVVTRDGQRFLVITAEGAGESFEVLVNWPTLRR